MLRAALWWMIYKSCYTVSQRNLEQKTTLKELADNIHLIEYHFHRLFRKFSSETSEELRKYQQLPT